MRRLLLPFLAVAVALAAAPRTAAAQQDRCAGETQTDMNICADARAWESERRLNALLSELYPMSDPAKAATLRVVQLRWADFARRHCEWVAADFEDGSMQPMVFAYCIVEVTEQRITTLRPQLCGDAACDCPARERYAPPAWWRRRP